MQRIIKNTLLLFAIGIFCSACGGGLVENPVTVSMPTLPATSTSLPKTTSTPAHTPFPTQTPIQPAPTSNVISLSENDEHYLQLKDKGYRLVSSGSLVGPEGFTYSAYLFVNPALSPLYAGSDPTKDTLVIAFYRWDGEKNEFINAQGLPAVDNVQASAAGIADWDQPYSGIELLDVYLVADEETKPFFKQGKYSSDFNQNGLPEFTVAVEYCPLSCTHPTDGLQLFEIQTPDRVKNITEDLPGLTHFDMHSKNPFTFYVGDSDPYDIYVDIGSYWIYAWDGSKFVDVSKSYTEDYMADANSIVSNLKSHYGKPFDEGEIRSEIDVLTILKLYEKAGISEEGLQVFLDITDISHWPNTSTMSQCWLQISRAMAQEDLKRHRNFGLPPSYSLGFNEVDQDLVKQLEQAGYDTSACTLVNP
jgi:hypothetical protein